MLSSAKKGTSGGAANWGSGFLPTVYQGVPFRSQGDPILYLSNPPGIDAQAQRESLDAVARLNRMRLAETGDPEIATRIAAYEMAYRMQTSAPELMDLSRETKETLEMYGAEPGKPSFANNCLLARRLVERGVRFVQLFHEDWDHHGGLEERPEGADCGLTDQAVRGAGQGPQAARPAGRHAGHLGRRVRPHADGAGRRRRPRPSSRRLHHVAGRRRRQAGHHAGRDRRARLQRRRRTRSTSTTCTPRSCTCWASTTRKLTYRFQGRDFRLTDVHGEVVTKLLA